MSDRNRSQPSSTDDFNFKLSSRLSVWINNYECITELAKAKVTLDLQPIAVETVTPRREVCRTQESEQPPGSNLLRQSLKLIIWQLYLNPVRYLGDCCDQLHTSSCQVVRLTATTKNVCGNCDWPRNLPFKNDKHSAENHLYLDPTHGVITMCFMLRISHEILGLLS